jgi:FkbM family methyltransferase
VFEKLTRNVTLNKLSNVGLSDLAVSDANGSVVFYDVVGEHQHSASIEKGMVAEEYHIPVTVTTVRLDDFCNEERIHAPDLIKIDVEMHEPHVLRGMGALIAIHKPAIVIEVLTDAIGAQLTELLAPHGYLFFDIDERSVPVLTPVIRKSSNLNYLACQPHHADLLKLPVHAV